MNPTSRLEEIFFAALERTAPADRAAYLDEACDGDSELRERVDRMLVAQASAGSFLEVPVGEIDVTIDHPITEGPGTVIGPYKLLQQVGEGGFGVVYMAEQREPVRRKVALKIIKPGMDTKQVIARFEAERQALALMDHPNIARVFDAGATDSGRPYFVMELVKGIPLTEYCDRNQLSTRERLGLLITVCHAVQHAHHKGIIHRDIKPCNIMVTLHDGKPVPKVIDFGVSKAISQQLTEKTLFTAYGQMVGTPQYMSPEQAEMSGLDVDTRSDVYSLGVLLYELLTGSTPLESDRLRTAGYAEMQRIIREEDPPKPSVRLSTAGEKLTAIAKHRSIDTKGLRQLISGELDWIVMKSIDKDRNRRYGSAISLATDIERFLNNDTVEACPPSTLYKLKKFTRRNRLFVSAAIAVSFVLVLGIISTTIALVYARGQTKRANSAFATAQEETARTLQQKKRADDKAKEAQQEQNRAEQAEDRALQQLYRADVDRVRQAYNDGNISLMNRLLEQYIVLPGTDGDLRGFEWFYWWRIGHLHEKRLLGLDWGVYDLAVSPDGQSIVGPRVNQFFICSLAGEGTRRQRLVRAPVRLHAVVYVREGTILAAAGNDGQVYLWDSATWFPLKTLEFPASFAREEAESADHFPWLSRRVLSLAVTAGGGTLAAGTNDGRIALWNTKSWELLDTFDSSGCINSLAFSPDGATLVAGKGQTDYSNRIRWLLTRPTRGDVELWDVPTGSMKTLAIQHSSDVLTTEFSPNGRWLATGSDDCTVQLWDRKNQELVHEFLADSPVATVAFSPNSRLLAAGTWGDNAVHVWDVESQALVRTVRGHSREVTSVVFLTDAKLLSSSVDGDIKVWDVQRLKERDIIRGDFRQLVYSSDGNTVFAASSDGRVQAFDPVTANAVPGRSLEPGYENVAFSAKGTVMVTVDSTRLLKVWKLPHLNLLAQRRVEGVSPFGLAVTNGGNTVAWNEDAGDAYDIVLFDVDSGTKRSLTRNSWPFFYLRFSPNGKLLLSGDTANSACVWDLERGGTTAMGNAYLGPAFSPDGTLLARGYYPNHIAIYDTSTWERVSVLQGHSGRLTCIAFSLDCKTLVSGAEDNTVRLWDVASAQLRSTFTHHTDTVRDVAFAPDGNSIVSCSVDGTLRILRTAPREEVEQTGPESTFGKAYSLYQRAQNHWTAGNLTAAARDLSEAIGIAPQGTYPWYRNAYPLGYLLIHIGRISQYEQLCEQLLADLADVDEHSSIDLPYAMDTAKACLFSRHSLKRTLTERATNLASFANAEVERAVAQGAKMGRLVPATRQVMGIAEYRRGEWASAIKWLHASADSIPDNAGGWSGVCKAIDYLFLAMSYHRSGQRDEAKLWLSKGSRKIDRHRSEDSPFLAHDEFTAWSSNWIVFHTVRQEAEELILGESSGR
jgi:WD40 repeat protein/serine/threonine protein kinase